MKAKNIFTKGFLLASVFALSGCSSFLDEKNWSSQSAEEYYATAEGYESLINGAYSTLKSVYNTTNYFLLTQLGTDLGTQNDGTATNALNQYTVDYTNDNGTVYNQWKVLYESLKNVNAAIGRAAMVVTKDQDIFDGNIPIILMGYLNPIMQYGFEAFCRKCALTGVDGMIIPDLPFADYMKEYKAIAERNNLKMIMLITPETSEERIRLIDEHTSGFIYMVSSASTTGAQQSFNEQKQAYFHRINGMGLRNPRLVGFGISNKATFDAAAINSSGAIIGSKFIQLLKSEPISVAVDKLRAAIQE